MGTTQVSRKTLFKDLTLTGRVLLHSRAMRVYTTSHGGIGVKLAWLAAGAVFLISLTLGGIPGVRSVFRDFISFRTPRLSNTADPVVWL